MTKFTIAQLRDMGFETVGDDVLFGAGPTRALVTAQGGEIYVEDGSVLATEIAARAAPKKTSKNADLG